MKNTREPRYPKTWFLLCQKVDRTTDAFHVVQRNSYSLSQCLHHPARKFRARGLQVRARLLEGVASPVLEATAQSAHLRRAIRKRRSERASLLQKLGHKKAGDAYKARLHPTTMCIHRATHPIETK
eukprot:227968-Pleurochrysis_carterae.AAC.2